MTSEAIALLLPYRLGTPQPSPAARALPPRHVCYLAINIKIACEVLADHAKYDEANLVPRAWKLSVFGAAAACIIAAL